MQKKFLAILLLSILTTTACQATQARSLISPTVLEIEQATKTFIPIKPSPTITENSPERIKTKLSYPAATKQVILMAVGDIMLGRSIGERIINEGYQTPFLYTADTLSSADITIGNLECPITNRGTAVDKTYIFRAPVEAGKALSYAGFDILSLGNNHILDYGIDGLSDTLSILNNNEIEFVGAGMDKEAACSPAFLTINGMKLAFLSFVDIPTTDYDYQSWEAGVNKPGIVWAQVENIQEAVKLAKAKADIVVVMLHNGYEFWQKVSDSQQLIAKTAIDSGAALVIGSHPHVLQRIEEYQGGLIVYSMGNFVFDNFLFPPNYSAILSVVLSPKGVESYELIDVVISLDGIPQIMDYTIEN